MTPQEFKKHRKNLGLTQQQLADKLGLSSKYGDDYIRMIEKGKKVPSGVLIRCFELFIEKPGLKFGEVFINQIKDK